MTSHTYNNETAEEVCQAVKDVYYSLFQQLETRLDKLQSDKT
ncbi:MAG: hypothetical protein HGJ93_02895 [Desulfosarcina sp.]|nr:hypothetical protein [Desulfosarcina sp.]MBC2764920.1 hypothetical protein [Desulfosarcina sp.]